MTGYQFDATDQKILDQIMPVRDQIRGPRLGDYVHFPTGQLERISNNFGTILQTSPDWAGAYFLHSHGDASFSGGLNPSIPLDSLTLTDEVMLGQFWFFHHGQVGVGRRVNFSISCRIYATSAEYQGYITKGI